MQRVCFLLKVRADRLAEYRERHAAVWPEMLDALSATGWHNYSLFLRDDGLLVGYLETEDFAAAQAGMEATDVNARWQAGDGAVLRVAGRRPARRGHETAHRGVPPRLIPHSCRLPLLVRQWSPLR